MISETMCTDCIHASLAPDGSVATCDAFPKGIPEPILRGKVEHTTPFPGDHGIMYEAKPGTVDDSGALPNRSAPVRSPESY